MLPSSVPSFFGGNTLWSTWQPRLQAEGVSSVGGATLVTTFTSSNGPNSNSPKPRPRAQGSLLGEASSWSSSGHNGAVVPGCLASMVFWGASHLGQFQQFWHIKSTKIIEIYDPQKSNMMCSCQKGKHSWQKEERNSFLIFWIANGQHIEFWCPYKTLLLLKMLASILLVNRVAALPNVPVPSSCCLAMASMHHRRSAHNRGSGASNNRDCFTRCWRVQLTNLVTWFFNPLGKFGCAILQIFFNLKWYLIGVWSLPWQRMLNLFEYKPRYAKMPPPKQREGTPTWPWRICIQDRLKRHAVWLVLHSYWESGGYPVTRFMIFSPASNLDMMLSHTTICGFIGKPSYLTAELRTQRGSMMFNEFHVGGLTSGSFVEECLATVLWLKVGNWIRGARAWCVPPILWVPLTFPLSPNTEVSCI